MDDLWQTLTAALEVARCLAHTSTAGLFSVRGTRLVLMSSHGLSQAALAAADAAWHDPRGLLQSGMPATGDAPLFLALPCGIARRVAGFLYVEPEGSLGAGNMAALIAWTKALGPLLVASSADEADDTASNARAEPGSISLPALLEYHDWNIARTARALGVTRATLYNRLRAAGVKAADMRARRRTDLAVPA